MPKYLDTRGNSVVSVAICDRCSRKFPYVDLMPDPNFPGMRVCKDDLDQFDPWRLPAIQTENIALRFPRPDQYLGTGPVGGDELLTQNGNAMFIEGVPPYSGAQGDISFGAITPSGNVPHPPVPAPGAVVGNKPTVLGVNPGSATHLGGTAITIQGLYFTGATAVTIGGINVTTFNVVNSNNITLTAPAHAAGFVTVTVTTPYGTGSGVNLFQYT